MSEREEHWDESRWGPAPPPERDTAGAPASLWLAAAALVGAEIVGVVAWSRGGWPVAVASVAIVTLVASALVRGRGWARALAALAAAAQLGITAWLAWAGLRVPSAFAVELTIRGLAALYLLRTLLAADVRAFFRRRAIERFG